MSYRLYVRPVPPYLEAESAPAGQLYHWVLQDANGDTQAHGSGESRHSIEQVLAQNALEHVQLLGLVPGEDVLFCVADIPARQSRYIAQALPYAVEEQIAQDIDTVHLALGEPGPDGYRVAAIDRDRMGHWFDLFSGWTGTRLTAIFPDAALLPATEGGWSICLEPELAMLVSDRGEWLNVQPDNLEMLAQTLAIPSAEEVAAEVPVTLFVTPQALERHASVVASLKAPGRLAVREEVLEIAPLELLAHADHHHLCRPVNLCQGMFSIRSGRSGILGPWKPLVAVASVWFVLQIALEVGLGLYYRQQTEQLEQQAMAIYHQAFPNDRRTHAGNVRRVIEGQLRVAGDRGPQLDFINLMKYTGQQYSQLPVPDSVVFNSVNYSRNRGELVVDLRADSYERLSGLRNGLAGQGLEAQIGSVVNESGGTRGRLTVSGG